MSRRWNSRLFAGLGWVLLMQPELHVQAQESAAQPRIKVEVAGGGPYWVGQQVPLLVTLMAPGYFASSVSFQLPDPNGVLLIPPSEHPVVGNESLDDTMYVTQQYDLGAWPMRPGDQEVPPFTLQFAYKSSPLDENAIATSVTTQPLPLKVNSPPGSGGMGIVISARQLKVKQSWKPPLNTQPVKAGTAFTRTVEFSAPNLPGMVFPPFPTGKIDGLGIYSKQQVLDQNQNRGDMTGVRRDVITYIPKQPGQFTIPAVQFSWFDLDSNQLRTETFAAQTLNVVQNPEMAAAADTKEGAKGTPGKSVSQQRRWWMYLTWLLPVLLLVFLLGINRSMRQQPLLKSQVQKLVQPLRPVHLKPLYPQTRD